MPDKNGCSVFLQEKQMRTRVSMYNVSRIVLSASGGSREVLGGLGKITGQHRRDPPSALARTGGGVRAPVCAPLTS